MDTATFLAPDEPSLRERYSDIVWYAMYGIDLPGAEEFKTARGLHSYCINFFFEDAKLLNEFGRAAHIPWAKWVASVSPLGDAASKLEAWARDGYTTTVADSRRPEGPVFATGQEAITALRECLHKVSLYCCPIPPPKKVHAVIWEIIRDFIMGIVYGIGSLFGRRSKDDGPTMRF
jgi:hypothetical protein